MSTLTSYITENPFGKTEECAKFVIDDLMIPFVLKDVMTVGQEYTLSFWIKADMNSNLLLCGETVTVSSEWSRCVLTFTTKKTNLEILFDTVGTYYMYHPQLEKGNIATDYTPAPEDVENEIKEAANDVKSEMEVALEITKSGIFSIVSETYATKESVQTVETMASQTSDKISWIVKSGTSLTDFTLTDRVASLLATEFDINALTTFKNSAMNGTATVINGGSILTGTITADKIDVADLFAQNITATNLNITGNSTLNGVTATDLTVTGNSKFSGTLNGATGSFTGSVTATSINLSASVNIYKPSSSQYVTLINQANNNINIGLMYSTVTTPSLVSTGSVWAQGLAFGGQFVAVYNDYEVMLKNDGSNFGLYDATKSYWIIKSDVNKSVWLQGSRTTMYGNLYAVTMGVGFESPNEVFMPVGKSSTQPNETADGKVFLGASAARWKRVYAAESSIYTSDEREKEIIGYLEEDRRYVNFFMKLKPIRYRWIDHDDNKRIQLGLGAQTTERFMFDSDISMDEFAGITLDKFNNPTSLGYYDRYGISYQQFDILTMLVTQQNTRAIESINFWKELIEYQLEQARYEINELKNEIAQLKEDIQYVKESNKTDNS